MIFELNIKNFAIVEDISINFTSGFNILTGETGTGKSIIVEALNMVLGDRASKSMVKTGSEKAILEGVFYIGDRKDILEKLDSYGIDYDNTGTLIISREIYGNGRSVSRINSRTTTLSIINDISRSLVDIHGQNEHQSLLNTKNHLKLVDTFAKKELEAILDELELKFNRLKDIKDKLDSIDINSVEKDRKLDLYEYQLKELESIDLDSYDEEAIFEKYNFIANIKDIEFRLKILINSLKGEDYNNKNPLDILRHAATELEDLSHYDSKLSTYREGLAAIYFNLEEILADLDIYLESIDLDEETYSLLGEKISLVEDLKRKYGPSLEDVKNYKLKIIQDIDELKNNESTIEAFKKEIAIIEGELEELSSRASSIRKEASKLLKKEILKELKDLNMKDVDFHIAFTRTNYFTAKGYDRIEFLISTNLGEELKPLKTIVSGGEMSRIMLGFKTVFADYDNIETLIFDEIDTGISGRTAQLVGEKLDKIAESHQVISISHLPQIASLAKTHFLIDKVSNDKTTKSTVRRLTDQERILEISRLIGGHKITKTTEEQAKEMLGMV